MTSGLALTGIVAYAIAYFAPLHQLFYRDGVNQFGVVVRNQPTAWRSCRSLRRWPSSSC